MQWFQKKLKELKYKIKTSNQYEFNNIIQEKYIIKALIQDLRSKIIRESGLEDFTLDEGKIS